MTKPKTQKGFILDLVTAFAALSTVKNTAFYFRTASHDICILQMSSKSLDFNLEERNSKLLSQQRMG